MKTMTSEIPGASALGYGFNALGNYDVSSLTQQIFTHQTTQASTWTYEPTGITYYVPDNTSVLPNTSTTGAAEVFSTRQQFQESFATKAKIKGSYGAFSAQFDFAYSTTFKTDKSYYYALYDMDYTGWNLSLADHSSAWVSKSFINDPDVEALPSAYTEENRELFFTVFRKFGTHYVNQVTVGGALDYYLGVEQSYSSDEMKVQANVSLEYKALFVSASAQASADWSQLGEEWTNSRSVKIAAVGGDSSLLNSLTPQYGDSYATTFTSWTSAVMKNPAVIGFGLRSLDYLFSGDKAAAVKQALDVYLNGAIVVTSRALYTPKTGPGGGNFTTSSSVIVEGTSVRPIPEEVPPPPFSAGGVVAPIGGHQVALLHADTLEPILSWTYYQDWSSHDASLKMYDAIMTDVGRVKESGYICILSGFGIDVRNYPTAAFCEWLSTCGAAMNGWKQYVGYTSTAGLASYVVIGKQGLLPGGALESFAVATDWIGHASESSLDISSLLLLYADSSLDVGGKDAFASIARWSRDARR
ncbi:hypothetical protein A7982_13204 [Minicystis rosea]|nr:hypothetical protein A7982_13204 [Minicystis rosea]